MGDDTQIQVVGKDRVKLENGMLKNVLYVPSLVANLLSFYQMTHTSSPKKFSFGLGIIEISYISIGNLIDKGVPNHSSKAYEFSHFFSYSHQISLLSHEKETIIL